jgi:hypothetical protein
MSKVLYSVDDVVELVYDPAINSLVVNWSDLGPHEHLRECLHAQLDSVKSAGAKAIVINTAKAHGNFERKDQEWFVSHMVGELKVAGVKAIVTVFPEAILPRLASLDWKRTGPQQGVNFIDASTLDMARDVAAEHAF